MLLWMREHALAWHGEGVLEIISPYGNLGPLFFLVDWQFSLIGPSLQIEQRVLLEGRETKSLWSIVLGKESHIAVSLTGEEMPHMQGKGRLSLTEAVWTLQEVGQEGVTGQERHWRDDRGNCYFEACYGSSDHKTEVKGVWRASRSSL